MFAPGTVLHGRYCVETELGVGGCSLVLRARDRVLDQPVAIKILRSDVHFARDMETRLMREARAIAQLRSEHVVRIFDVGALDSGAPFLVMELLHGSDLGALLAQQRALAPAIAVDFILQACDALAEAHARGIVHRDIKPSNLFVVARLDGAQVIKVVDFGISKSPMSDGDPSLTQTASLLGTPSYMAPEQMRSARAADARSDVWALGAVLYELVEGRLPFTGDSFAELVLAASTQPHHPMTAAPQLAPIVARCLAKSPDERYGNVAELAAELAPFTAGPIGLACVARTAHVLGVSPTTQVLAVVPSRSAPVTLPMRTSRSLRRAATVGAVAIAIAVPALILAARGHERASRAPEAEVAPARAAPAAPAVRAAISAEPAPAAATPAAPAPPAPAAAPVPATPSEPAAETAAAPSAPPPVIRDGSAGSAIAAPPIRPSPHRRPRPTAASGSGCDPYARPEGC